MGFGEGHDDSPTFCHTYNYLVGLNLYSAQHSRRKKKSQAYGFLVGRKKNRCEFFSWHDCLPHSCLVKNSVQVGEPLLDPSEFPAVYQQIKDQNKAQKWFY